jgi:hypothetical protein
LNDLNRPLGLPTQKSPLWRRIPTVRIGAGLLLLMAAGIGGYLAINPHPLGGEPTGVVKIDRDKTGVDPRDMSVADVKPEKPAEAAKPEEGEPKAAEPRPPRKPAERIGLPGEGQALVTTPVARITDKGKYGPLPKIGQDGARPLDVYARPAPNRPSSTPRVVIVVGGMGLSQTGTQEAIRLLPPEVTLAFAPYGGSLDRWMQKARQDGHEVLLQLPMEPFDYPDNDPGPHTLLTTLPPAENLDRLQFLLSRMTNYVGVTNFMGAKFTANESNLGPVLKELAARGVMFLDDGSSGRSQSEPAARAAKAPYARADLVIDATPTDEAITARLGQLEGLARSKGLAIGTASALPLTLRRLADWTKALDGRGILVVPASAAARDGQG